MWPIERLYIEMGVYPNSKYRGSGRSLDGLGVVFQVLMPEDSGSNPEAGSIYSFDEVCPGLGLLQPQWNPYPTLTPPSC